MRFGPLMISVRSPPSPHPTPSSENHQVNLRDKRLLSSVMTSSALPSQAILFLMRPPQIMTSSLLPSIIYFSETENKGERFLFLFSLSQPHSAQHRHEMSSIHYHQFLPGDRASCLSNQNSQKSC